MTSLYDTQLNAILDRAIPARTVTRRPLAGIPTFQHGRLQSVLNAASKLIHRSSRHEHITPLLLRVQQSPHGAYTPARQDDRRRCYKTRPEMKHKSQTAIVSTA